MTLSKGDWQSQEGRLSMLDYPPELRRNGITRMLEVLHVHREEEVARDRQQRAGDGGGEAVLHAKGGAKQGIFCLKAGRRGKTRRFRPE